MSKGIKLFVLASVLLNLVLIGVIAGHMAEKAGGFASRERLEKIVSVLPQEKREAFKEKLEKVDAEGKETRAAIRRTREEVVALLVAEPFDEAAYRAKASEMHRLYAKMGSRMTDFTVDVAKVMTQEERTALAEALKRRPPRSKN